MTVEVLFVDDDADVRQAYGQALELHGLEVTLARALIEAVDHLSPSFPGVVVTDVRMPGRDGFDMLARVQKIDPEIPVVLLTGEGDIPMALRALEEGAVAFLEKPCPPAKLIETLRDAAKTRTRILAERRAQAEKTLDKAALPTGPLSGQLEALECQLIEAALAAHKGHVPTAAEQLGLPRKTLYDKIKRMRIDPAQFRN